MLTWEKTYQIQPEQGAPGPITQNAEQALSHPIRHITDAAAPLSEGGPHDYYSNGDYWWPDPPPYHAADAERCLRPGRRIPAG